MTPIFDSTRCLISGCTNQSTCMIHISHHEYVFACNVHRNDAINYKNACSISPSLRHHRPEQKSADETVSILYKCARIVASIFKPGSDHSSPR